MIVNIKELIDAVRQEKPWATEIDNDKNTVRCKRSFIVFGLETPEELANSQLYPQLGSEHPEDNNLVVFNMRWTPCGYQAWNVDLFYLLKGGCQRAMTTENLEELDGD